MLAQLTERKWEVGTNPELKQHLSKVILEYKKGLDFYIGQLRNNNDYVQRYKQLAQYIEETGQFIDKLGEWIEEHPAREEKNAFFDAQPKIKTVINMLQIIFMSKQITIHNKIHSNGPLMVYGKEIYFSIAFELIVNMALENAGPKQQIILSVKENKDFYIFTVNDPSYILFDEDAMKMNWRIQKVKASIGKEKSGDHDLEIFLECVYENNGEMRFESSLAHGTSSSFSIPKRKLL